MNWIKRELKIKISITWNLTTAIMTFLEEFGCVSLMIRERACFLINFNYATTGFYHDIVYTYQRLALHKDSGRDFCAVVWRPTPLDFSLLEPWCCWASCSLLCCYGLFCRSLSHKNASRSIREWAYCGNGLFRSFLSNWWIFFLKNMS